MQSNSLDTCRLHPSGPFLTFDSFFRTTSFLDDTLHTLIFFFFNSEEDYAGFGFYLDFP